MPDEQQVLIEIRERLQRTFRIRDIVLFGSRAKGTARTDSDFDVLVIADSDLPFIRRQGLALLALGKRDYPLDLLVYTPDEADTASAIPGSAVYWALKEGRRLGAA
ncbi:MAG: nucleotidyltransferase domain-containing protein [Fimbriimonas sp.]